MNEWLDDIDGLGTADEFCIVVTVAGVRGSAPREIGTKMIVTGSETIGTIGGGQLEYQCTRLAFEQLRHKRNYAGERTRRRFPLGSNCGQCCGGVVDIMFERIVLLSGGWLSELKRLHDQRCPVVLVTPVRKSSGRYLVTAEYCTPFDERADAPAEIVTAARQLIIDNGSAVLLGNFLLEPILHSNFHIAIFGAGHVGAATVDVLSKLDCRIRWIDSRRNIFPARLHGNVTAVESAHPALEVAAMPQGSSYLVLTHSHPLDFEICARVLQRGDFAYCGLIGSRSKRRRFERSMRKQGMPGALLQDLTCPIGVSGIDSKKPVDIAIAVAAEMLQIRDAAEAAIQDNERAPKSVTANVHVL